MYLLHQTCMEVFVYKSLCSACGSTVCQIHLKIFFITFLTGFFLFTTPLSLSLQVYGLSTCVVKMLYNCLDSHFVKLFSVTFCANHRGSSTE